MRTYPDTSLDLRLRGAILLSNCVRGIVDTFRVHRFSIRLCALDLQALDVCEQCFILQPRFLPCGKALCDFLGVPLVCRDWRFGQRQRGRFPIR